MELPRTIPLFPLPNVVLFPGVPLPLHIFEQRYRAMVRDAADSHEIIGMVLLRGEWKRDYERSPQIFQVGCAGRIVNVETLADGRSNILLHGVREFRLVEEIPGKAYRQAVVEWLHRDSNVLDVERRDRVDASLQNHLQKDPQSPAHQILADDTLADEILVNFFSYVLDVPPLEKQALLEEPTLSARAERLCEVVDFCNVATTPGGDNPTPGRFH